jgi:hypothetical protein
MSSSENTDISSSRETGSKISVLLLSLSSLFFNLGANIQNLFELSKFYNLKVEIIVIRTKPPIIFSLILLVLLIIPKEMLTFVPDGEP